MPFARGGACSTFIERFHKGVVAGKRMPAPPAPEAAQLGENMLRQRISVPETEKNILPVEVGHSLEFAFDTGSVSFDRSGNDLDIVFENGSSVTLEGFFAPAEGYALPVLLLEDGTQVLAADFLHTANPLMDTSTAAGPDASSASQGLAQYSDYSGTLLAGVDRLGILGTDGWARSTSAPLAMEDAGIVAASAPAPSSGAGSSAPTPDPEPEPGEPLSNHTRLCGDGFGKKQLYLPGSG